MVSVRITNVMNVQEELQETTNAKESMVQNIVVLQPEDEITNDIATTQDLIDFSDIDLFICIIVQPRF